MQWEKSGTCQRGNKAGEIINDKALTITKTLQSSWTDSEK